VLEEDNGLRDRALRDRAGERALELEGLAVRDEAEIHQVGAAIHSARLLVVDELTGGLEIRRTNEDQSLRAGRRR
jgi:hypothetical protein